MTEPVTSIFSNSFKKKAIILSLIVIICTIKCINVLIYNDAYRWGQVLFWGIFSTLLWVLYVRLSFKTLVKVTASPDGLVLENLITKKRMVIDYADIKHVENLMLFNENSFRPRASDGLKLLIELSTGETFSFTNLQYVNYGELKEAIRRYRFHLD